MLDEYVFEEPAIEGNVYSTKARLRDGNKLVGEVTFQPRAVGNQYDPHFGYHRVGIAKVHPDHQHQGIYGKLLQLSAHFVKNKLKSKGLVSIGDKRSDAATGAWQKISGTKEIYKPGEEDPDIQLHSKEKIKKLTRKDREASDREFLIALKQWLNKFALSKSDEIATMAGSSNYNINQTDEDVASRLAGGGIESTPEFSAARFMANNIVISPENLRLAILCYENDLEMAALFAYGLPRTEENRAILQSVMSLQNVDLSKSEINIAAIPRLIEMVYPESENYTKAIQRGFASGNYRSISLNGKHSKGTAVVFDPKDRHKYLLKPGSGKLSPSAGVREQEVNQSRREVAFYYIAKYMGLNQFLPHADLINVDGEEVAAMELVPSKFKNLNYRRRESGMSSKIIFETYVKDSTLYKWAFIDMVLGNPDRHAGNVLVDTEGNVKLIDHGTSFAGFSFNPAVDNKSFIPTYLRFGAPGDWQLMSAEEKYSHMPHPTKEMAETVSMWIDYLKVEPMVEIMERYGIIPDAIVARFNIIKELEPEHRVRGILEFWSGIITEFDR